MASSMQASCPKLVDDVNYSHSSPPPIRAKMEKIGVARHDLSESRTRQSVALLSLGAGSRRPLSVSESASQLSRARISASRSRKSCRVAVLLSTAAATITPCQKLLEPAAAAPKRTDVRGSEAVAVDTVASLAPSK